MGHEKGPRGLELRTGDCGNTADGAGNRRKPASLAQITRKNWGLPEPQTSIFFLRYNSPDWAKGVREDSVCVCGYFKGLWDFNEDNQSLL